MADSLTPEDAAERMEALFAKRQPGAALNLFMTTIASLTAELAAMRDEVMLYREAAVYNVMMGGAVFTGRWNMSALNRARKVSEAARAQASFIDAEGRSL